MMTARPVSNWRRYEQHAPDWSRRIEKDQYGWWRVVFEGTAFPACRTRRNARVLMEALKREDAQDRTRSGK